MICGAQDRTSGEAGQMSGYTYIMTVGTYHKKGDAHNDIRVIQDRNRDTCDRSDSAYCMNYVAHD